MVESSKEFVPGVPIITGHSATSVISLASPEPLPRMFPSKPLFDIGYGMSITQQMDLEDAAQDHHQVLKKFMVGDLVPFPPVVNPNRAKSMVDPTWLNSLFNREFKPEKIVVSPADSDLSKPKVPGHLMSHHGMTLSYSDELLELLGIDVKAERARVAVIRKSFPLAIGMQTDLYLDEIKKSLQEKHSAIMFDSFVEKKADSDG